MLLKTDKSHLEMDAFKKRFFHFGAKGLFSGAIAVSFREGIYMYI